MNQDQTTNNDLQKAIDDITNTTNIDPVFSDPVAAPSSVPEGDTGELGEAVGPFPEPKAEVIPPAPDPIATVDDINIPDLMPPVTAPQKPIAPTVAPEPAPAVAPQIPEPEFKINEPVVEETRRFELEETPSQNLNMRQVKEAALRDLVPLLDQLNMNSSQKFNIYRNIFEELKDYTVLEPAYRAASEITDPKERAESLLYLVESIDKM